MTRIKYLLLVILVVFLPYIAGAEMYQWVDGAGVKHYTNTAPPEGTHADSSWGEMTGRETDSKTLEEREAAIIKEAEDARRQAEIDAAVAKEKKARQEALDAKKAELKEVGDRISRKRRYVKRRGKSDMNKIERLDEEIATLKKNPNANPEKIKSRETEVKELKDKFYSKSGRGRKGVKDDVQRYRQLEQEIEAMEKLEQEIEAMEKEVSEKNK